MKSTSRWLTATFFTMAVSLVQAQAPQTKDAKDNPAAKAAPRDAGWMKTHEAIQKKMDAGGVDVLFVGDSITQGWNGAKEVWEKEFKDWKPGNLGIGGDQTQHVLWRITEGKEIEKIDPKVIVLMIGTNNTGGHTPEQIAGGIKSILDALAVKKPKAKVLLLGVFPRSNTRPAKNEEDEKEAWSPAATEVKAADLHPKIKAINDIIAKYDNGTTVKYLDINKVFLDDAGNLPRKLMPDFLHLSKDGYAKWAAAIKEPVQSMLK